MTYFQVFGVLVSYFLNFCTYCQQLFLQIPFLSFSLSLIFREFGAKFAELPLRNSSRCTQRGFPYWIGLPFSRKMSLDLGLFEKVYSLIAFRSYSFAADIYESIVDFFADVIWCMETF